MLHILVASGGHIVHYLWLVLICVCEELEQSLTYLCLLQWNVP